MKLFPTGLSGTTHDKIREASVSWDKGPLLLGCAGVSGEGGILSEGWKGTGQVLSQSMGNAFLERSEPQKHFLSNNRGVTVECAHDNRALSVALQALLLQLHPG